MFEIIFSKNFSITFQKIVVCSYYNSSFESPKQVSKRLPSFSRKTNAVFLATGHYAVPVWFSQSLFSSEKEALK